MENFRIESLEISQVGVFNNLKIDFPEKKNAGLAEIHILTGENGTGKTTILEMLAELGSYRISKLKHGSSLIEKLNISESSFQIKSNYTDYKLVITQKNYNKSGEINKVGVSLNKVLTRGGKFSFAIFSYSGYRRTSKSTEVNSRADIPYSQILEDSTSFDKSINTEKFSNWIGSILIKEALLKTTNEIDKSLEYRRYISVIEEVLFQITGQNFSFYLNPETMYLNMVHDEQRIGLDTLPDGVKSIVSWVGDLIMRMSQMRWIDDLDIFDRSFILLLDEIEVHLHPAWQRKILPVIQKLFKNAQIFISTHSPFVVGSVDGAWIYKFKRNDNFVILDGLPTLSEDAKSVRRILDEVFDVKQQYGVSVEEDLQKFREIRNRILKGESYNLQEFRDLTNSLASQSTELSHLLGSEINQLQRILNKEVF
ncbi:AAA family ATPase [Flectobacillus rivi]|uniref:AAA family ATPase n=1 Tax=Flectobacillus rivi TaxID=2984209 RepID=A0ABT6YXH8_9BACT|nr:AAA family ATPase [Flectobacillus rivi]MDI9873589.1 AAA family ATPase [Flectobacillus rivi]